jgi:hypothetical protein
MVRALTRTAQTFLASLKEHGTTIHFRDQMLDFDSLNELLETREILALDAGYNAGNFKGEND